jgi:hypothetical protein
MDLVATRTSSAEMNAAAATALRQALTAVGARASGEDPSEAILPNGRRLSFDIVAVSVLDEARANAIAAVATDDILVVADLIGAEARAALDAASISWLDRRGHLRVTSPGVWIDRDIDPLPRSRRSAGDRLEIRGASALAVAVGHLLDPTEFGGVRPLARLLGLSPSAISQARTPLARRGLLTDDADALAELFWAVSAAWRPQWVDLPVSPVSADGLVAGGTLAAAARGAPIIATDTYPLELHAADADTLERIRLRAGQPRGEIPPARVTVAPTPLVTKVHAPIAKQLRGHRVAHPLFVALDLAADPARGAEALAEWEPEGWPRAW